MEAFCKRCQVLEPSHVPGRGDNACPQCGAQLQQRVGPPPGPKTHFRALLGAVFSVGGILVMGLYGVVDAMPFGRVRVMAAIMLYLTAVKMAYSAMNTSKGTIRFPTLDPRDFFGATLWPVAVYVLLFITAPAILIQSAMERPSAHAAGGSFRVDGEDGSAADEPMPQDLTPEEAAEWQAEVEKAKAERAAFEKRLESERLQEQAEAQKAAKQFRMLRVLFFILAALLLLYSAMALVLFLQGNTIGSMFDIPLAARLISRDAQGYLFLAAIILGLNAVRFVADTATIRHSLALVIPFAFLKGAATLLGYGVCGLYVRQNARTLECPCDEEDWEPMPMAAQPPPAAPSRTRHAPAEAPSHKVFTCKLGGRDPQGVRVLADDGRAMVLNPQQVAMLGAAVVNVPGPDGAERPVAVLDLVMQPASNKVVLRFQSDTMALDTVFPGTPPADAFRALVNGLLQGGASAWPDAQALAAGDYPQLSDVSGFEKAFVERV